MDFKIEPTGIYARVLAVISLFLGLSDAARLLGVTGASGSPLATLGPTGFILLTVLSTSRLFAALGLWMKAQWGAVLLVIALAVEIGFSLAGNLTVRSGLFGFIFKLVLMLATILLLVLAHNLDRRQRAD